MSFLELLGIFYIGTRIYKVCKWIGDEYEKYAADPENYQTEVGKNPHPAKPEAKPTYVDMAGKELTADTVPAKLEVYTDTTQDLTYYILYRLDNTFIAQGYTPEELVENALERFPKMKFGVTESFSTQR